MCTIFKLKHKMLYNFFNAENAKNAIIDVPDNCDVRDFLIVTGTMRSGTTLLGELLHPRTKCSNHPALCFSNDMVLLVRKLGNSLRAQSVDAHWMIEDPIKKFVLNKKILSEVMDLKIEEDNFNYNQLLSIFSRKLVDDIKQKTESFGETPMFGLKTTHLIQEIDLIKTFFPNVKTLIMIRDPRDVLASNIGRVGLPEGYMVIATILSYLQFFNTTPDNSIKFIKYEKLVTNPISELEKILDFLNLDKEQFNWESITGNDVSQNSSFGKGSGKKLISNTGINLKSIGNYKNHLSFAQRYFVERLLEEYMGRFGYATELKLDPDLDRYIGFKLYDEVLNNLRKHNISNAAFVERCAEIGLAN